MDLQATWRSWLVAVFGAWFVVDSFIYQAAKGHSSTFWSFLVIGALMLILSGWVAVSQTNQASWASWVTAVFGAWMAVSPWALKFTAHSQDTWVTLIVGVLALAASVWVAIGPQTGASAGASRSASS